MIKGRGGVRLLVSLLIILFFCFTVIQCDQKTSGFILPKKVDFNYDVKPILVQNCYLCHGPDPSSRKANLRLDTYEGATTLIEGRRPIAPGSPGSSELIRRITHEDPGIIMPPPETNLKLGHLIKDILT